MSEGMYTPPPPPPRPPVMPPPGPPPAAPSDGAFDFVKPFTFVFEDPNWLRKVLIGGLFYLLTFLIVGLFFIAGYVARLVRNVARGEQYPLPEWDDLGEYFGEGLKLALVAIIYVLPIIVVLIALGVPAALMSGTDSEVARNFGGGLMGCAWCLMIPFSFLLAAILPVAYLRTVMTGRIGAAFEFGEIFDFIRSNFTNYLLAIVVHIVAQFASQLGIMLLCVGIIFTAFWSIVVSGHAFGQAYRLSLKK
jgi:hypothetical protein